MTPSQFLILAHCEIEFDTPALDCSSSSILFSHKSLQDVSGTFLSEYIARTVFLELIAYAKVNNCMRHRIVRSGHYMTLVTVI